MASMTLRSGKVVEVKPFTIEPATMVSVLRLKEDFELRGEHLSTNGVILHLIDKGISVTRNYWTNVDRNKSRRDFSKLAAPLMRDPVKNAAELHQLAVKYGLIPGTPVDLSKEEEPDVDDELLEQLTDPTAQISALSTSTD